MVNHLISTMNWVYPSGRNQLCLYPNLGSKSLIEQWKAKKKNQALKIRRWITIQSLEKTQSKSCPDHRGTVERSPKKYPAIVVSLLEYLGSDVEAVIQQHIKSLASAGGEDEPVYVEHYRKGS